jgi:hypothetical protein
VNGPVPRYARVQSAPQRANLFAAILALAGIVVPTELQLSLGPGVSFPPGRISAAVLFLPALLMLLKRGRQLVLCDFLAPATAAWMIVASLSSVGASAIPTAGGDALDFLGGYLIARAYFFGRPALDTFVRVLKVFAFMAIVIAVAESISMNIITHNAADAAGLRNGWARAASTFDHPIPFGVFCALTAAILLSWEKTTLGRSLTVGFCFLGCALSLSSAALIAFAIVLAAHAYDQLLKRYSGRWTVFWTILGTVIFVVSIVTAHPLAWILTHLTYDPQTGFYRLMTWEMGLAYIAQSPIVGYGYFFNNELLDNTIDSIWLVFALRFGIPVVVLLFLANVAVLFPGRQNSKEMNSDHLDQMRRAFTLVILLFMFTGLTVHFWKYILMFWGLSLGVRASLRELTNR